MAALHAKKIEKKTIFRIDRQLRELFDNSDEFKICMLDESGRIIGWNKSAERLTGFSSKDVMGKEYSIFISKEDRRKNIFKKALAVAVKKGSFTTDGIRVRKDGSHFWARSIITVVKERSSERHFFVVITRDVSREKEMMLKKEEYIGIASHELRNPIQTLSLYSEILGHRLQLDRDKENIQMLRDMQGQTARLITLVDDLLLVSKVENGKMELHREEFDPALLIKDMVRDFQHLSSTHRIVFSGKLGLRVRADKGRVGQVFINLMTNAIKYSPVANKVFVQVVRRARKCVISVRDEGSGIALKDQRNIFTRFYRSSDAEAGSAVGAGLGIYISKEIIKRHRERIWVKSAVGKGTTFSFTLSLV